MNPDPRTPDALEKEAVRMLALVGPHKDEHLNELWAVMILEYIMKASLGRAQCEIRETIRRLQT